MQIIKQEGVWRLFDQQATLILTDEKQLLRIIENPSNPLFDDEERGHSGEKKGLYDENYSLLTLCENAQKQGARRLEVSYDFFFGGTKRENYPDSEVTIKAFKIIRDTAREYGMTFGASIINPLDIGGGYAQNHTKTGQTYNYLETEIKSDGSFSAAMVLQRQWYNNKGPITLQLDHVEVYAFQEERIGETPYFYVNPDEIQEITAEAQYTADEASIRITGAGYGYGKLRIYGKTAVSACNRCLCIAVYKTPEIDYFSEEAYPYIKEVLDKHRAAGIDYEGFYSDEMHIQFDWDLGQHFGETEINTRYLTPSFAQEYAAHYGERFHDFAKYLVYFSYHQHDFLGGEEGKEAAQHVWGKDSRSIYETWLFRKRYFEMLQTKVVKLSCDSKVYAESLFGAPILTRAHATWQESPTCDHFYSNSNGIGGVNLYDKLEEADKVSTGDANADNAQINLAMMRKKKEMEISSYDYTKYYDWSASIREDMSGCYDYFKWNDYLSGGGSDHPEGGNADRCYYAEALASSFGALNAFDLAYAATWGSPDTITHRFYNVGVTYGNPSLGMRNYNLVQDMKHRASDVLALYPLDLNYVEERFGSWMVQYGYCNYITEDKLLERAHITKDGKIVVNGFTYQSLVILFEPLFDEKTLAFVEAFLNRGGKVVWTSVYPVLSETDCEVQERWQELFGIQEFHVPAWNGKPASGSSVEFQGSFAKVSPMAIITDLLPDRIYPFTPMQDSEIIATCNGVTVGAAKKYPLGGLAVYVGFRPRDDQSQSLGYDVATLYEILYTAGAYAKDSLEVKSRPAGAKYIYNRFNNGAVAVSNHYRTFDEAWDGSFFRNQELDKVYLKDRILPPTDITLREEELCGHKITYTGEDALSYCLNEKGELMNFCGTGGTEITIDGKKYSLCSIPMTVAFAKVDSRFLANGIQECYIVSATAADTLTLPLLLEQYADVKARVCDKMLFTAEKEVPFAVNGTTITIPITDETKNRFIAIYR